MSSPRSNAPSRCAIMLFCSNASRLMGELLLCFAFLLPASEVPGAAYDAGMVREAEVISRDRRIRYLEAGAGWPVVLLHAFPVSAAIWQPQLERVPDGFRFIAPDLAGFGGSSPLRASPTMDGYADDVVLLLDHLEIERAT